MSADGTQVPKWVGVLIVIMNYILLNAFVGECIDLYVTVELVLCLTDFKLQISYKLDISLQK